MALTNFFANTTRPRPILTVATIFLGAVLTTFQGRLFSAALPDLRGQFGLDVLEAAWLGTALNSAQLVTMPIAPWLATVIGPTRLLVAPSLMLGLVAFLIPAFAHHYPVLVTLHAIVGLCLGIYLPLTISLALRSVHPRFWLVVMGAYSLRVSTGMDAGYGTSAFLVEEVGWHWVYWTTAFVSPVIAFLAWKALPLSPLDRSQLRQGDWAGLTLFCSALVLAFIGIDSAERLGWSDSGLAMSTLAGGVVLFCASVLRALIQKDSFSSLIAFGNRNICICLVIACLFGVLMTPTSLLIPTFLTQMGNLKPMQTGTATWIAFGAYLAATPLAIYLARRIEPRLLIICGLIVIALTAWQGTYVSHDWRVDQFVTILGMQSLGESIMLTGLIAAFVTNLNPLHGVALGAYVSIARVLMPVAAGTVMSTWLRISGDTSRTSLSNYFSAGDPWVVERAEPGVAGIAQFLAREAHVAAHISGYHLVFWCSLLTLSLAVFIRPSPPNQIAPPLLKGASGT
ncbi:TPA: MFS transporter [Klebsiella pneumoniae]|uniref:MFS transporter n=1 Tax=Klebsiella pneumoniae TaxID=573 RepID=UPI002893A0ED|nr:MFS transporter [Klebsiella pneumoniae]MEA4717315.1 MFS transporter [Klebsiella pneumoniae]HBQ3174658.1 MFS transporter [Klebsiella pneumoniae]HBS7359815.1 MFS transporter [Klebsiella pneumoniae]HCF8380472.1 MFS transporter [Klebsiella pneumoniae]